MRISAVVVGLFALCIFLIPLTVLGERGGGGTGVSPTTGVSSPAPGVDASRPVGGAAGTLGGETADVAGDVGLSPAPTTPQPVEANGDLAVESFSILNRGTGKVEKVSVKDYVRGAVASEMPATFHTEALKAQAVSAHTYALNQHLLQLKNPDPALKGADFSADPAQLLGYTTEAVYKKRLGDLGEEHWNKVCGAADSVLGYVLVYEGEPIVAAYHSISGGMTEDAENVWSGSVPYLVAVESPGDLISPALTSTVSFTEKEMKTLLTAAFPKATLGKDPAGWLTEVERSPSGYITRVEVGDWEVHGKELRTALGLKSTDFTYVYQNGAFDFTVLGYGHGVGLSQYGADYMGRQGETFDEILAHYYVGAELALIE